jgi:hypothetical protein
MAVWLFFFRAGSLLSIGRFLVLVSVRGRVDPLKAVPLEGLDQLKNLMALLGIKSPSSDLQLGASTNYATA